MCCALCFLAKQEKEEFHIENVFSYIDQLDVHAARLTVKETFEFAHNCKTGGRMFSDVDDEGSGDSTGSKPDEGWRKAISQANEDNWSVNLTLTGLGLNEVGDTFVGDEHIRGVSGGQRRRVTVGEMLTYKASVLCGDEISTGLDAASTYDMIQVLLYFGKFCKLTRVISLLQPSPETVSLFDEVIVLAEGQVIYAGPVNAVEDYFAEIGFLCPQFMDCADFLQVVCTEERSGFFDPEVSIQGGRGAVAPTISELAETFRQSELGKQIRDQLEAPHRYVWKQSDNGSMHGYSQVSSISSAAHVKRKYANRFFRSMWLILKRFLVLWVRDKRVIIAGVAKNVLMGVSVGGVYVEPLRKSNG